MSRRCVSSSCLWTSESARPRFCSAICALKPSMPPYWMYRGGLPPVRMSGRYFNASSSHVVTCARMSFTDQLSMTPGSVSCESDKPAYDSSIVLHAFSSCFRSCCLSMIQVLPPFAVLELLSLCNRNALGLLCPMQRCFAHVRISARVCTIALAQRLPSPTREDDMPVIVVIPQIVEGPLIQFGDVSPHESARHPTRLLAASSNLRKQPGGRCRRAGNRRPLSALR